MNLIIMGPVGSGKSTQARLIAEGLNITLLNAGDLLYYKSLEDTTEGKKIKAMMESGGLVDEAETLNLVTEHLKGKDFENGVIIDGFPRNLWQAQNFNFKLDKVIYLSVSDDVNRARLLKRGRGDDAPDIITKRLEIYHKETEAILDFYKSRGILIEINGERSIEDIFKDIMSSIQTHE